MYRITISIIAAIALYASVFCGWTIYIDITEFQPAESEWQDAHARNDRQGELTAFKKEFAAISKGSDPRLWWHKAGDPAP